MSEALPRLLLVSPPLDRPGTAEAVDAALAAAGDFDIACLLLRGGTLDDAALAKLAAPVIAAAQARDIAVLLEDRPDLLEATGADGLHLEVSGKGTALKALRRRFGDGVILGAGCGASRHLAMTAGEQGADYIGFGGLEGPPPELEIIAWWEAVMTPPQVAFGARSGAEARALAAAGTDFLGLPAECWLAGADPAAALRELLAELAENP